MDPKLNPFAPGAGTRPPELVGRAEILRQADIALARIKQGRPEKSIFLVGLRGVGKTVLLHQIFELAKANDYKALKIEIDERRPFPEHLVGALREIAYSLQEGNLGKRFSRILSSFIKTIKPKYLRYKEIELGFQDANMVIEAGVADSGDLTLDLPQLFMALAEAAKERKTAIAIIIDELQYLEEEELSALIMAVHSINQAGLPLLVIGAGLPQLVGKAGKSKSYAERLFDYPSLDALSEEDANRALQDPVKKEGLSFTLEALQEIFRQTRGYPFFLQEWGYQAWNLAADDKEIDLSVIKHATVNAITSLDRSFFRVRFDRLTPKEKAYLRGLAELGAKPQRSGDIAKMMGLQPNQAAPIRNSLIKKGMLYSPIHGDTAFTVPLFSDFMKRTIPVFEKINTRSRSFP